MSLINQISILKKGIELLEQYSLDGEMQPHESYALLKESGIVEEYNSVIANVKQQAIDNLRNNFIDNGKKTYKDGQYAYTVKGGATRYYYSEVDEYKEAQQALKTSGEYIKVKAIEQKYKTAFMLAQKGQTILDEETGELIDPSKVKVVYSPDVLNIRKL